MSQTEKKGKLVNITTIKTQFFKEIPILGELYSDQILYANENITAKWKNRFIFRTACILISSL